MTSLPPEFLNRPLAHRALHDVSDGRPENSRAAIKAAISAGYGLEIDVQLSADGVAMVFHDYTLDRLTDETGAVRLHKAAALRNIRLRHGTETIPDLPEVLDLVGGRAPVLIEIKDQDGEMGADVGPLETAVAHALEHYKGPIAVMSFNPHSMDRMRVLRAQTPRGLVTSAYSADDWDLPQSTRERLREIPDFDRVGASFISHEAADLSRTCVADLKQRGIPVLCWTIRTPEEEAVARQVADNVTFEGYRPEVKP